MKPIFLSFFIVVLLSAAICSEGCANQSQTREASPPHAVRQPFPPQTGGHGPFPFANSPLMSPVETRETCVHIIVLSALADQECGSAEVDVEAWAEFASKFCADIPNYSRNKAEFCVASLRRLSQDCGEFPEVCNNLGGI